MNVFYISDCFRCVDGVLCSSAAGYRSAPYTATAEARSFDKM